MDPSKQALSSTNGIKKPLVPSGIPKPGSGIPTMTPIRKIPSLDIKSLQTSTSSDNTKPITPRPNLSKLNTPLPASLLTSSSSGLDLKASAEPRPKLTPSISKLETQPAATSHAEQPQVSIETKENDAQKLKIKDLEEKLETLKIKRAEDRDKLREYEKTKLQLQTLQEFKSKAQQEISDLNKELVQTKQESKLLKEQFEAYREEMNDVEARIEETTVDKELAEAKVEDLQEDINRLNDKLEELQLELDVLKGEIETNGVEGAAASFAQKQNEKEQERLKGALIKLRDMSVQDKSDLNGLRKLNEELNTKLKSLQKDMDNLKVENTSLMTQIVDLKDQVTATLGSVQMIEQLTEQNLDLEQQVIELKETMSDLEAINEVNDQLQESAREEERELRQLLDMAESRIREYEKSIESLKYTIADHEKTIVRYRDVVKQQQNENDTLQRKLQAKLDDEKLIASQASTNANFDFKSKLIESKNYAKVVECELAKIESTNLKKYISYLLTFMNETFLKRGGDHECLQTILLFKRLMSKCDFLIKEIKEKFPVTEKLTKDDVTKSHVANQSSFFCLLNMLLAYTQLISSRFDAALDTCSFSKYQDLGCMLSEFQVDEKPLDSLIDLLGKNQLDETINIDSIEKACIHFQTIYQNHLNNDELFDCKSLVEYLSKFGLSSCDLVSIEIQRLQFIIQSKDFETLSTEIIVLFKEIFNSNEEIKIFFKKIHKLAAIDEKKSLLLNKEYIHIINSCIKSSFCLAKVLNRMCHAASADTSMFMNENGDGIPAKRLEDLAYQVCDQVYFKDDADPYENIRSNKILAIKESISNSLGTILGGLAKLLEALEEGVFERELDVLEQKTNAPIVIAAELFKHTLIEAETIKYKLEGKDDEIKELKKHLRFKNDELSETKVRLTLMEKKYEVVSKESEEKAHKMQAYLDEYKQAKEKYEKEHAETLEILQLEVDTLQAEKRELKDKLKQMTVKSMVARQTPDFKSPSVECSTPKMTSPLFEMPIYVEEIKLLKSQIKILEETINELRVEKVKCRMDKLSKLPSINKTNLKVHTAQDEQIRELQNESNELLKNFYSSIIDFKVPNFKEQDSSKARFDVNLQTNLQFKHLTKNANELQSKINTTLANLVPGSHVKTSTSVFQTPEYARLLNKKQQSEQKQLVAEIHLPCPNGNSKIIDLTLNNDDIKDVFRMVSAM